MADTVTALKFLDDAKSDVMRLGLLKRQFCSDSLSAASKDRLSEAEKAMVDVLKAMEKLLETSALTDVEPYQSQFHRHYKTLTTLIVLECAIINERVPRKSWFKLPDLKLTLKMVLGGDKGASGPCEKVPAAIKAWFDVKDDPVWKRKQVLCSAKDQGDLLVFTPGQLLWDDYEVVLVDAQAPRWIAVAQRRSDALASASESGPSSSFLHRLLECLKGSLWAARHFIKLTLKILGALLRVAGQFIGKTLPRYLATMVVRYYKYAVAILVVGVVAYPAILHFFPKDVMKQVLEMIGMTHIVTDPLRFEALPEASRALVVQVHKTFMDTFYGILYVDGNAIAKAAFPAAATVGALQELVSKAMTLAPRPIFVPGGEEAGGAGAFLIHVNNPAVNPWMTTTASPLLKDPWVDYRHVDAPTWIWTYVRPKKLVERLASKQVALIPEMSKALVEAPSQFVAGLMTVLNTHETGPPPGEFPFAWKRGWVRGLDLYVRDPKLYKRHLKYLTLQPKGPVLSSSEANQRALWQKLSKKDDFDLFRAGFAVWKKGFDGAAKVLVKRSSDLAHQAKLKGMDFAIASMDATAEAHVAIFRARDSADEKRKKLSAYLQGRTAAHYMHFRAWLTEHREDIVNIPSFLVTMAQDVRRVLRPQKFIEDVTKALVKTREKSLFSPRYPPPNRMITAPFSWDDVLSPTSRHLAPSRPSPESSTGVVVPFRPENGGRPSPESSTQVVVPFLGVQRVSDLSHQSQHLVVQPPQKWVSTKTLIEKSKGIVTDEILDQIVENAEYQAGAMGELTSKALNALPDTQVAITYITRTALSGTVFSWFYKLWHWRSSGSPVKMEPKFP